LITIAEKIKNTGELLTTHQQLLVPFGCTKRNSPPHASVAINIKRSGGEKQTPPLQLQIIIPFTKSGQFNP